MSLKSEHEKEVQKRNSEIQVAENRIKQKEQSLDDKIKTYKTKEDELEKIKGQIANQQSALARKENEVEQSRQQQIKMLKSSELKC